MIRKYFALSLITASLLAAGCSSDDDDDDDTGTVVEETDGATDGDGDATDGDADGDADAMDNAAVLPAGSDYDPAALEVVPTLNLAELATNAGLNSLVANVANCEFAPALSDVDARLTVFAPNDEAFAADAVVAALGAGADVCDVIAGHVLVDTVAGSDVLATQVGTVATTLAGTEVEIGADAEGGLTIGGSPVIGADNFATNGVAHVISAVILPAAEDTADEGSTDEGMTDEGTDEGGATGGDSLNLGAGIDAAQTVGLTSFTSVWSLSGFGLSIEENPWTVFAATNTALDGLDTGADEAGAFNFLQNYIGTTGGFSPAELLAAGEITTNGGVTFTVGGTEDALLVNGHAATVIYEGPGGSVLYSIDGAL